MLKHLSSLRRGDFPLEPVQRIHKYELQDVEEILSVINFLPNCKDVVYIKPKIWTDVVKHHLNNDNCTVLFDPQ